MLNLFKTMNHPIQIAAFALVSSISLSGCLFGGMGKKASNSSTQSQAIAPDAGTIGVKNVSQLAYSMSTVTGVELKRNYANGRTLAYHNGIIAPWLSPDGNVETVNSSMLLSITGLAGNFCKQFIADGANASTANTLAKGAHQGIVFNSGPAALTEMSGGKRVANAKGLGVIGNYSRLFLRRELRDEEREILSEAFGEAATQLTTNSSTNTQNALLIPCTALLSSVDFLKQ